MPEAEPSGPNADRREQVALHNLVAVAIALTERMPQDFAYRRELLHEVGTVLGKLELPQGWFDALAHEHGVEIDRVLQAKPGEYDDRRRPHPSDPVG